MSPRLLAIATCCSFLGSIVLGGCADEHVAQPERASQVYQEQLQYRPGEHPAARAVMGAFSLMDTDILAVQKMVFLKEEVPFDSVQAVITDDQWYYVTFANGAVSKAAPAGFSLATEIDVYGSYVEKVAGWYCGNYEWAVTFYLPVCFHETSPGRFDGILDAWAPTPNCSACNGGWCIGGACGIAWDGPGYQGWWDYHTCRQSWSKKVGKLVQKRWLYTWRNCGYPDWQIASWVRARIRY